MTFVRVLHLLASYFVFREVLSAALTMGRPQFLFAWTLVGLVAFGIILLAEGLGRYMARRSVQRSAEA